MLDVGRVRRYRGMGLGEEGRGRSAIRHQWGIGGDVVERINSTGVLFGERWRLASLGGDGKDGRSRCVAPVEIWWEPVRCCLRRRPHTRYPTRAMTRTATPAMVPPATTRTFAALRTDVVGMGVTDPEGSKEIEIVVDALFTVARQEVSAPLLIANDDDAVLIHVPDASSTFAGRGVDLGPGPSQCSRIDASRDCGVVGIPVSCDRCIRRGGDLRNENEVDRIRGARIIPLDRGGCACIERRRGV
ncbi:hypothetical protein LXA43DRAFT_580256 [Ganoderma leucocontextum]|nr:hypothetical protein LXA43DRAFT_580256 [Ganoderma leucocontextum]